jgi:ABC-type multidrug transport system fused ATPase/permease subunit
MQTRAALVSINLFSLLCVGNNVVTVSSMGGILRYGGPIVYLIIYSFILLATLVWVDSGTRLPRRLGAPRRTSLPSDSTELSREDVIAEVKAASTSEDLLRVLNVSKSYQADKVVDNVSLGVSRNTLFALLGPNGAGKTTTFNMIRE